MTTQPTDSGATAQEPILSIDEQKAFYFQRRLGRAGIPRRFINKTLDTFETRGSRDLQDLVKMAKTYISSFGAEGLDKSQGAVLDGPTGSGKTHMLISIMRSLIAQGHEALYYNVPELFNTLRASFDGDQDKDEDELLQEMIDVPILALDDLGAEKTSEWVLDRLYLIVNKRYELCRPILVTTNLTYPEDLERGIGPRIVSRLAEMCSHIGPFPQGDWRMKNAGLQRRI